MRDYRQPPSPEKGGRRSTIGDAGENAGDTQGGWRRPIRLAAAVLGAISLGVISIPAGAADTADLWAALRSGGHVVVMRHALAPGTGDPQSFDVGKCETQRNLSTQGRAQAKRIGDSFRANGIAGARVYSSQWCRCLDTAELLRLGPVATLPALNSFFQTIGRRTPQTAALQKWLSEQDRTTPLVLVTHQVNITALTGIYPASGEMVVLRIEQDGALKTIGTMRPD